MQTMAAAMDLAFLGPDSGREGRSNRKNGQSTHFSLIRMALMAVAWQRSGPSWVVQSLTILNTQLSLFHRTPILQHRHSSMEVESSSSSPTGW